MGKRLLVGLFVVFIASIPGTRSVEAEAVNTNFVSLSPYSAVLMVASEALGQTLYRQEFRFFGTALFFRPVADGGGDGGSDGGSGTGTGGDGSDGGSDSGGSGSDASDSSGSASDSTGPSDNSDPDSDPAPTTDPTDPTAVNNTMDFATQQAHDAVANPFGSVSDRAPLDNTIANSAGAKSVPGSASEPGSQRSPGNPGQEPNAVPPAAPPAQRRAEIHAVIVSGLADPSQVLTGNVHLTGGIVALGSPDPTAPQTPGRWDPNVKITPDPELLNGHKIPPLVPNVIDVRIMHHEVSATIESAGSISGQPVPAPNNAGSSGP